MSYVVRPLSNHKYSQCHVVLFSDGTVSFVSYRTKVIEIDTEGYLTCFGTYSQTTRKQIGWFLREYAPCLNYYTAKDAYEQGYKIHITNGDIVELPITHYYR